MNIGHVIKSLCVHAIQTIVINYNTSLLSIRVYIKYRQSDIDKIYKSYCIQF